MTAVCACMAAKTWKYLFLQSACVPSKSTRTILEPSLQGTIDTVNVNIPCACVVDYWTVDKLWLGQGMSWRQYIHHWGVEVSQ